MQFSLFPGYSQYTMADEEGNGWDVGEACCNPSRSYPT